MKAAAVPVKGRRFDRGIGLIGHDKFQPRGGSIRAKNFFKCGVAYGQGNVAVQPGRNFAAEQAALLAVHPHGAFNVAREKQGHAV